jgi:hypothetical protein
MTTIKFGDQTTVTASPGLILKLEKALEEWLEELLQESVINERSCLDMSQRIVRVLFEDQ